MVVETRIQKFVSLGLSKYEACAYLGLLGYTESTAVEVAERAGVPRQRVYDVLASLHGRGMISSRAGRLVRYTAHKLEIALETLLENRRRQQRAENDRLTALAKKIASEMGSDVYSQRRTNSDQASQKEPLGGF